MHRLNAIVIALALALPLGGCLSAAIDESDGYGQCTTTDDCASGEVCIEGLCYGNPPQVSVSAQILPPATRPDLAATEIESLAVTAEGSFEMVFAPSAEGWAVRIEVRQGARSLPGYPVEYSGPLPADQVRISELIRGR